MYDSPYSIMRYNGVKGKQRYTTVGSGKGCSSASLGPRNLPFLAQPGALGLFLASVFPPGDLSGGLHGGGGGGYCSLTTFPSVYLFVRLPRSSSPYVLFPFFLVLLAPIVSLSFPRVSPRSPLLAVRVLERATWGLRTQGGGAQ